MVEEEDIASGTSVLATLSKGRTSDPPSLTLAGRAATLTGRAGVPLACVAFACVDAGSVTVLSCTEDGFPPDSSAAQGSTAPFTSAGFGPTGGRAGFCFSFSPLGLSLSAVGFLSPVGFCLSLSLSLDLSPVTL